MHCSCYCVRVYTCIRTFCQLYFAPEHFQFDVRLMMNDTRTSTVQLILIISVASSDRRHQLSPRAHMQPRTERASNLRASDPIARTQRRLPSVDTPPTALPTPTCPTHVPRRNCPRSMRLSKTLKHLRFEFPNCTTAI